MKTAYLIRTGEMNNAVNVSNKLRSSNGAKKALRACKRMGIKGAYAAKMTVSSDARLK